MKQNLSEAWGYLLGGAFAQALGVVLVQISDSEPGVRAAGYVVAGIWGVMVLVAVVAFGVLMALRGHDTARDA